MPIPILPLLGVALLGGIGFAMSRDSRAQDSGYIPPPDDSGYPPTDDPEAPPMPEPTGKARSGVYSAFLSAYAATPYHNTIAATEGRYGLPVNLLARLLYQESGFNPEARGNAGEIGIAQFLPATAADYQIDPTDPNQSIDAAALYLRALAKKTGTWWNGLVAYNWGIGNVERKGTDAAPAATLNYASNILADSEA